MKILHSCIILLLTLSGEVFALDFEKCRQYFQEAEEICRKDGGKLWGVSLCSPLLLADPKTRQVAANQPDPEKALQKKEGVYTGALPPQIGIANTALKWNGLEWTMIVWPLPVNPQSRARLIAHELWHRVQDDLGLPMNNPPNSHLDSLQGRAWLQLEMRALAAALQKEGSSRSAAIADALLFRAYRQSLFPGSAASESALEMNEGLAEYTGVAATAESPATDAIKILAEAPESESFVRSFAYATGAAYGVLLDENEPQWRNGLTSQSSMSVLLQKAINVTLPEELHTLAMERSRMYGGEELMRLEAVREKEREERLASYRKQFVDGPVLILPLQEMNFQFDPNNVQVFEPWGTVYPELRLTDRWGILTVKGGALITSDWTRAIVTAPEDVQERPLRGDGWTLDLNEGWSVRKGEKAQSFEIYQPAKSISEMHLLPDVTIFY